MNKWDKRFIGLAEYMATFSKDPSIKVGAVIVDDKRRILGTGYNGFPRGVHDDINRYEDREIKLKYVVHSEANAILSAVKSVEGATIYIWPLFSCNECAKLIIQSGIKKVVALDYARHTRWGESYQISLTMYKEAGVEVQWMK